MPIKICYFAWVADLVGQESESRDIPADASIESLLGELEGEGAGYSAAFADRARLRFALDGQMADQKAMIGTAKELAIFPPVTGG